MESSPRWGGFWERLIKSIKRSLTYIGNEVDEILTPGHLLMGKRILKENNDTFNEHEVSDRLHITKRASYLKSLSEHYWKR